MAAGEERRERNKCRSVELSVEREPQTSMRDVECQETAGRVSQRRVRADRQQASAQTLSVCLFVLLDAATS